MATLGERDPRGWTSPMLERGRTLLAIDPTRHSESEKAEGHRIAVHNALWRFLNGR